MVRMMKTPLAVALLLSLTLAVGQVRAEIYTYSGILPQEGASGFVFLPGPDMVGLVSPGDRWTVTLDIDLTADDVDPDASWGDYPAAIEQAEVRFEGTGAGYSATLVGDFGGILVYNDIDWGDARPEDGVLAIVGQGDIALVAEVATKIATADPLSSDALPVSPTQFTQSLDDALQAFQYVNGQVNDADYWEISYFSASGETFQAVPEPSTIMLWCFAAVGLGFVGWRKRRAS